jgi:predicted DNA-binding transcriptional regulator AlpA
MPQQNEYFAAAQVMIEVLASATKGCGANQCTTRKGHIMKQKTEGFQAVDTREAAGMLGLSKSHLEKLRLYNPECSPPWIRIGRSVRYSVEALRSWADAQATGGEAGAASRKAAGRSIRRRL